MDNHTVDPYAQAQEALSFIFTQILLDDSVSTFEDFENKAISALHRIGTAAIGEALERHDRHICADLPEGYRVHDKRSRTLATEIGDVSFCWRRVRGPYSYSIPLADVLDIPWGARISPGAEKFLLEAGAEVSYLKAAKLLERKGGSKVSPSAVMGVLRRFGALCEQDDEGRASELYDLGISPGGEVESEEICIEADGVWVPLQKQPKGTPTRAEIKGLVSYSGKVESGQKVKREHVVRHGCVASPHQFWPQGIASIATKFNLSKVNKVHLGVDGEGWCKSGASWLPMRMNVDSHLDPFHVNRAVLSCFADQKEGWKVLEVLLDGDKEEAITLLEICRDEGIARKANADRVIGYLRNNLPLIGVEGPSLGTMESENQHLYSARMESVPCAWSRRGASDMARIRSRMYSGRDIPRRSRTNSTTPRRRRLQDNTELKANTVKLSQACMLKSVGSGYLPPQASIAGLSAKVRYAADIDWGMMGSKG